MLVIVGALTVGGASWLALAAAQSEKPQAPAAVAPAHCQNAAVACSQTANCHQGQSGCNAGCKDCTAAKDQNGDGRCDAAQGCGRHSGSCAAAHPTGTCQMDGVVCRGTKCGDCKDFRDTDADGACDKVADCGKHSVNACSGQAKRGTCHTTAQQPEAVK